MFKKRKKVEPVIIGCSPESDGSFPVRYYEEQEVRRIVEENLMRFAYMLNETPILRKDGITIELTPHLSEQSLLICVEKIAGSHTVLETRHYEVKTK